MNVEQTIDEVEEFLAAYPAVDCPLRHSFTPGLYIREVIIPAGTWLTSKIHRTEHPFVISKGKISVWVNGEITVLEAPYQGITVPGTRRVLFAHEDTTWTTFHVNVEDEQDLLKIEHRLIEPHDNPLLDDEVKYINNLNQKT